MRRMSMSFAYLFAATCALMALKPAPLTALGNQIHPFYRACLNGHPAFPKEHFRYTEDAWPLFAWTQVPFDPAKPSVLFFNGGPGQSSHGQDWSLEGWNVIFWDQLGVACSKPELNSAYFDQASYSIENTADDALKIVKLYGLNEVSVLAVSYGTAPATVFAHRYPQYTRVVVLEGTLATGTPELHNRAHAQKILIRFFYGLSESERSTLRTWSKIPGIEPTWFSRVGYYFLTLNDGLSKLDLFLKRLAGMPLPAASFFNNFGEREFEDDPAGFSAVVFAAIACGELSQDINDSTSGLMLTDQDLLVSEDNDAKRLCRKYGFSRSRDFLASRYSIARKVIYFQGVLDGATEATQAIEHFQSVPKGGASLFLRVDGGHSPLLGEITDRFSNQPDLQKRYREYLSQALLGQDPDLTTENSLNWKLAKSVPK